ncbi:MFS transporter [Haloarcula amylovorans]|uniref:MFS transporter n=1 Tax=Haloarcula amylovorans TaxID=2562280 RepID=UPI001FD83453|nr:MFS transporter [Halomicroarcula amylolytica]
MTDSASSSTGVPWRSPTVQVVLASTALAPLGVPLVSPGLSVLRDVFGLTDAATSLLISSYFLVGIVLSPFIGLLSDRIGRKRTLVAGLLTFGVLGGAMAFAPSFEIVLALRIGQGTGAAAIFITTVTIISETFEGTQRNTVLGVNVAVLSAAAAVFPVLGGILVTAAWNAPFLTYFAAVPVALFAAVALDEPTRTPADRGVAYLRAALDAVATPATLSLFGVTFLTEFLAFGVVFTAIPFLLARIVSPVLVGLALFAAEGVSMVVAASSGRLVERFANERLVGVGFACYGVGFLTVWIAPSFLVITAGLVVVGAGIGILLPAIDAALSGRVPPEYRAGAFSLRNSTTFLGRSSGPIVFVGLAITVGLGYERLLLAAGVVAVGVAALALSTAE